MEDKMIYVAVYEIGMPMVSVKVESGSTVRSILEAAGKQLEKNGKLKRVKNVSSWDNQPYLNMDDKFSQDHGEIFLGEHEAPNNK